MPTQKKIKKALKKVKKAKKEQKAKRRSRATQNMSQIVNIKGLGGLGSKHQQPFIFQAQREGPVSSSQDFFTSALKQLNRVNAPSESTEQLKENIRKIERDLNRQNMINKQVLLEADMLKTKYDIIASRSDNVGDFSQPNKPRDVAKQEEKFQDQSTITPKRGNKGGPMSEESKAKGRATRAENKAKKEAEAAGGLQAFALKKEGFETPPPKGPAAASALGVPEDEPMLEEKGFEEKGREAFI